MPYIEGVRRGSAVIPPVPVRAGLTIPDASEAPIAGVRSFIRQVRGQKHQGNR
jgi:hypothetical protein